MPRRRPREAVKRSKTFTGCWTCRSRGVKCGEEKPVCARCSKGSFHCEGYGVKLVWPDEYSNNPSGAQRRLFTQLQKTSGPTLSELELDISLSTLDAAIVVDQEQDGLFSVFRLPSSEADIFQEISISRSETSRYCVDGGFSNQSVVENGSSLFAASSSEDSSISTILEESGEDDVLHYNKDENLDVPIYRCRSPSRSQHNMAFHWEPWVEDAMDPFGPLEYFTPLNDPGPREERELMHYWVTHLSDLMISAGLADNPYRTVWVPMALESTAGKDILLENSALLHAIYALSAFNKFQRVGSSSLPYSISAIKHYQLSLEYLRQALMQQREAQLEVVLATISALSLMEVINGNFSFWRKHLKGGRAWLRSIERGKWTRLQKSATYQFFLCAEAIGSFLPRAAENAPLENIHACAVGDSDYVHDSTFGVTNISLDVDYVLDRYFGITKPILEAITHINHILASPYRPSKTELEGLEIKILLNRPISISNRRANFDPESQALVDYKMMFYYACHIHFKHNLLHTTSEDLQGIVRHSLLHLQNIEIHETTYGCCGILWPIFLIACESDERKSRNAFLRWFSTKARLGIGSLALALAVVIEVWRRRDAARSRDHGSCFVSWEKVMAEMGLDLFII
jgi:arginine metabolism regulation protein II